MLCMSGDVMNIPTHWFRSRLSFLPLKSLKMLSAMSHIVCEPLWYFKYLIEIQMITFSIYFTFEVSLWSVNKTRIQLRFLDNRTTRDSYNTHITITNYYYKLPLHQPHSDTHKQTHKNTLRETHKMLKTSREFVAFLFLFGQARTNESFYAVIYLYSCVKLNMELRPSWSEYTSLELVGMSLGYPLNMTCRLGAELGQLLSALGPINSI